MDKEIEAAFAGIMVVLGELTHSSDQLSDLLDKRFTAVDSKLSAVDTKLSEVDTRLAAVDTKLSEVDTRLATVDTKLSGMATMTRMNDGFERVLRKQQILQVANDTLSQRVTQLEEDVRQLRGGV